MFVIIYTILCRNPELQFTQVIELDKMVEKAIQLYCYDNNLDHINRYAFFNEKPSINNGTTAYLSRVCIESLLKSTPRIIEPSVNSNDSSDSNCRIS